MMEEKPAILVSACLLGVMCKYSGGDNYCADVLSLRDRFRLIPVCPEQLGGLPTPRPPAECRGCEVITREGTDVTMEYHRGANAALYLAQVFDCHSAILKARSPSCGSGAVYDGTFTGTVIPGDGVTAQLLKENGISVRTELELHDLLPDPDA